MPEERYVVDVKAARCPAKFWGKAKVVRVVDTSVGPSDWYWVRRGTVRQWGSQYNVRGARHLDARYSGPESAFGRAVAEAKALASRLNRLNRGEEG
jgi:hypothetical protein